MKTIKQQKHTWPYILIALAFACVMALPMVRTFAGAFGYEESFPTLAQFTELLVTNYTALYYFWNSLYYAVIITVVGVGLSFPLGFLFAKVKFRGLNALFFIYILVMMLPFQVTLLPNYIQLRDLSLLDTRYALIIPMLFSPFAVFLLRQFMKSIPAELLDYILLESSSVWHTMRYVVFPHVKNAVAALSILLFCEAWNMIEQPLIFASKNPGIMPLSIALGSLPENVSYAAAMIYIIPILLIFIRCKDMIQSSIVNYKW